MMAVIGSDEVSEETRPRLGKNLETDASAIASCVNEINFPRKTPPGRPTLFIDALSPWASPKYKQPRETAAKQEKGPIHGHSASQPQKIPHYRTRTCSGVATSTTTIKTLVSPVVGPVEPTLSAEGFKTAFNVAVQKNARPISASIEEPQRRARDGRYTGPNLSGWAELAPPASLMDAIPGLKIRELEIDLDKAEEFMEHTIQTSPYALLVELSTHRYFGKKIAGLSVGHSTNLQSMLTHGVSAHHVMSNQKRFSNL
ncbi:hypothetical protein PCE1_004214 [Barthelona sp. PCE]